MLNKKFLFWLFMTVSFCVLVLLVLFIPKIVKGNYIDESEYYLVKRVIDGDTFEIRNGLRAMNIRMLGIDTPETVDPRKREQCFGKEASRETRNIIEGKKVQLKLDPSRESKDKYGRILAYVFLENGLFINLNLLKNGFAKEYTFGKPYSKQALFIATQNEAKQNNIGLWGVCNQYTNR